MTNIYQTPTGCQTFCKIFFSDSYYSSVRWVLFPPFIVRKEAQRELPCPLTHKAAGWSEARCAQSPRPGPPSLAALLPKPSKDIRSWSLRALSLIWHSTHLIISFSLLPHFLTLSPWLAGSFDSFYISTGTRSWDGRHVVSWNKEAGEWRSEG